MAEQDPVRGPIRGLRAALAALPLLLAVPAAAPAQPWAGENERAAGRAAIAAANNNRFEEAQALAASADPLTRKVVAWMRLQNRGQGSAPELSAWVNENPDWPFPDRLALRAEEALVPEADDALVLRHFALQRPRTLDGAARLADALTRAGRGGDAAAVLRAAWVSAPADALAEPGFLARAAPLLSADDHWARFDRLGLARDQGGAARAAAMLDPARAPIAAARLALAADGAEAEATVPAGARDLGLALEQARWLRRRERDAEAAAIWVLAEPLQEGASPEAQRAVWAERGLLVRRLLRAGEYAAAYRIAARSGQAAPGESRAEAEFLAGWIALRRTGDAKAAARHFAALAEGSTSLVTRSRAAYWGGRALLAARDAAGARARWAEGAALPTTYYGQLSALALGEGPERLDERIRAAGAPVPDAARGEAFLGRELPRAVLTLADLGAGRRVLPFLLRLEEMAPDAADRVLTARLAIAAGRPEGGVWVARRAGVDGVALLREGWPTPYAAPAEGPERAFVHAVTRQESNFDREAVSSSNARGLMQLLPATAAEVARQNNIPHALPMLTGSPAHNLRLGSLYLGNMLGRFDNNPALAAAAYNAGPRRVDEWRASNTDPDLVDWIEAIPFNETRNYVQRVIENLVVYRALEPAGTARPHPLAPWLPRDAGGSAAPSAATGSRAG